MSTIFIFLAAVFFPDAVFSFAGPQLKVSNVSETKIHVEWSPVVLPDFVIEKYQVSAYPIKTYGKIETLTRNEWTFYNTTFRSDLVGLHPGTLYNISVWAITTNGTSEINTQKLWTEVGDPDEPPRVDMLERDGKTMSINIPGGFSDNGPVTGYYVVPVEKSPIVVFNSEELGDFSMADESGLPFYIAAYLTPEQANKTFIVGDEEMYNGFYNAPLHRDREYEVLVGVVSSLNGVIKVSYSPLRSTLDSQKISQDVPEVQTSSKLSVILSAAIGVFGFLLVISVIIYFLLRKHYGKRRPSDEMVLRVHGSDGLASEPCEYYQQGNDENGFIPGMLQLNDDCDLNEVYEKVQEKYWNIPGNLIDVHQTVLGIGQFGEVREGTVHRRSEKVPCVVQYMQTPTTLTDKEKRSVLIELDMMTRVGLHTNVVEFLGVSDERDVLQVAIEHHPSSLRGLLLRSRQTQPGAKVTSLSEPLLLELAAGVAQGMAHLADRGIPHRHLSSRNVLIAGGSIPKIAHFGVGYYNPLGKKLSYTRWMAPEFLNMNTYTSKSDVWSFGILLWEIMTIGGSPYNGLYARDILPRVMQGMRLPKPKGVSDELYQAMLHCWELDADERPKFMELAAILQSMILSANEHINFQSYANQVFQYEKFDLTAEDQ